MNASRLDSGHALLGQRFTDEMHSTSRHLAVFSNDKDKSRLMLLLTNVKPLNVHYKQRGHGTGHRSGHDIGYPVVSNISFSCRKAAKFAAKMASTSAEFADNGAS